MASEQQIQSKILKWLQSNHIYNFKVITANKAGIPDIICCVEGRFVAFEVKTEGGIVSKLQEYNINLIGSSKGMAFIVKSLEEVKDVIQEIRNTKSSIS